MAAANVYAAGGVIVPTRCSGGGGVAATMACGAKRIVMYLAYQIISNGS